jgi:hypothetical protein
MFNIEKSLNLFTLYLQDPDNIESKKDRLDFEKVVLRAQQAIGKKFFGLISRNVSINEFVSYYACELLYMYLSHILKEQGFLKTNENLNYSSDIKSLFGVFYNNNTYVIILCKNYTIQVHFKKNFDTKQYNFRDVKNYYDRFVNKQSIQNPLVYKNNSENFIKEFNRRLKVYSWVDINLLIPKQSGFDRFMRTFD